MRISKNSKSEEFLCIWRNEARNKLVELPLPDDAEKLFKIMRDSDIKDIRKVVALQVSEDEGNPIKGHKIYYGIEDAVRSLYVPGCVLYMRMFLLRMRMPSGAIIEFHRMEYIKESNIDDVSLATYLGVVFESGIARNKTKVILEWVDENGKHSN